MGMNTLVDALEGLTYDETRSMRRSWISLLAQERESQRETRDTDYGRALVASRRLDRIEDMSTAWDPCHTNNRWPAFSYVEEKVSVGGFIKSFSVSHHARKAKGCKNVEEIRLG